MAVGGLPDHLSVNIAIAVEMSRRGTGAGKDGGRNAGTGKGFQGF